MLANSSARIIRFGTFEVNLQTGELRRGGQKLRLQEQPFQLLAALLERPGEVVTREELRSKLWPADTFVDFDQSLNAAIKRLRDVLDDSADAPRYIETLARRGYRFIAPVEGLGAVPRRLRAVRWAGIGGGAAVALLAALVAFNVGGWRERILEGSRKPIQSIAVLPLADFSSGPEQDYFAEGMTEALITELGKISALRVISRQTMMQYKGTKKSAYQIAHELNVEAVVEGSIVRAGDRVRISVQLIEAVPERHLWANSYDRDLRDVLALHSEMARAVASEIRIRLTPQERGLLAATRPVDPEVYAAYLKGRYFWNRTDLDKALESFQEAIKKDPSYAPAYAGVALCYNLLALFRPPKEVFPKARTAALKALEMDETSDDAHTALAWIKTIFEWDWAGGERELQRALELNPKSVWAHRIYGGTLTMTGRSHEGIAEARQAQELDPLSLLMNGQLGFNYWLAHRYDEAIAQYKKTLELDRNAAPARLQLFWCYTTKGMYPEALAEYEKLPEPRGDQPHLAYLYAASGRRQEALKLVKELTLLSEREYVGPINLVIAYARLDKDRAFEWLEKAYEGRSPFMAFMKVLPFFDALRSDPRFQDVLRRMNFPPSPSPD